MNKAVQIILLLAAFSVLNTNMSEAQWVRYVYVIPDTGEYVMRDMNFTDAATGWAAGFAHNFINPVVNWGVISSTHDGGLTWQKENIPVTKPFSSLFVLNSSLIAACGDSGAVVLTSNGGSSWQLLNTPPVSSNLTWSISFINASTGWISNPIDGTFMTTDGGATWPPVSSSGFSKIYFRSNNAGFGLSPAGLFHTVFSGYNWTNLVFDSLLTDFCFLDNSNAWCFSAPSAFNSNIKGRGRKSTNGGISWTILYSNDSINNFSRLRFIDVNTGYAVNAAGSPSGFSFTTNSGASWYNPCDYRYDFSNVYFPDAIHGFAGGTYFFFDRTTSGPGNYFNPYFSKLQLYQNSNNFSDYVKASSFCYPISSTAGGLEWPKGSGKYLVYTAGLCIAARMNGRLAIVYSMYNNDLDFGHIDNSGNASGRELGEYGLYQIKTGDGPGVPDWDNWPVNQGAPTVNGQPQLTGNMTTFASLADGYNSYGNTYGNSLKAEVKMLMYSYNSPPPMNDIIFVKYSIKNRSGIQWDSAYVALFADPDVGDPADDRTGSDQQLNLSYAYNSTNNDAIYGAAPPAVGFKLLQSPIGSNRASSAIMFMNLGYGCLNDPLDSTGIYYYFRAFDKCGQPFINNNQRQFFIYNGDPETNTGWIMNDAQDVRLTLTAGPFTLAPNDSTTFTFAVIVARGFSNLNSVTLLKQIAGQVTIGIQPISQNIPAKYSLGQNYPNPFNPVTTIKFSIPQTKGGNFTKLRIYDILGRVVATLVNSELAPGEYKIDWNASAYASGVYFYRLESGSFRDVKKMIVVK